MIWIDFDDIWQKYSEGSKGKGRALDIAPQVDTATAEARGGATSSIMGGTK